MIATGSTQCCQCRGLPMSQVVPRPALSERQERQGADADVHACSWHFDFTHPLAYMAHTVTNVPMPGLQQGEASDAACQVRHRHQQGRLEQEGHRGEEGDQEGQVTGTASEAVLWWPRG